MKRILPNTFIDMNYKYFLSILLSLLLLPPIIESCANNDEMKPYEESPIILNNIFNNVYKKELIDIQSLPDWIQEWIEKNEELPYSFVIKALNKQQIVYVLSNSYSSISPLEYYGEDGSVWHGDYSKFYDIKIIFINSATNTQNHD